MLLCNAFAAHRHRRGDDAGVRGPGCHQRDSADGVRQQGARGRGGHTRQLARRSGAGTYSDSALPFAPNRVIYSTQGCRVPGHGISCPCADADVGPGVHHHLRYPILLSHVHPHPHGPNPAAWQPFTAAPAAGAGARARRLGTSSTSSTCSPTATATPSSIYQIPSGPPATPARGEAQRFRELRLTVYTVLGAKVQPNRRWLRMSLNRS